MKFHIITLFPDMVRAYLDDSILGRAQKKGIIKVEYYNPRDFSKDKHHKVDSRPYGGGPGMVMQAEPILRAVTKARGRKKNVKVVMFSPSGKQFTNTYAKKISTTYKDVILIAGRYEGVDARVKKALRAEEISIGPYVLTGGELPAAIYVDAVSRQIKGVLGAEASIEESRVSSSEMYTRPDDVVYKKKHYKVPKVLLSGDHKKIEEWKESKSS